MSDVRQSEPVKSVRALLVTGGGPYETSLHSKIESFAGVDLTIAARDTDAFAGPLPERTDTVILVNRSATLAPAELRHYVFEDAIDWAAKREVCP